jgi:hypothetical protein
LVVRLAPGLSRHLEFPVDVAALAAVVAGVSAAVAILTDASVATVIAVIGLVVMVVTMRRPSPWLATPNDLTRLALSNDDLDACLAKASRAGTRPWGKEREAVLESVTLTMPGRRWRAPDVPTIRFRVREPRVAGSRTLTFDRPPSRSAPVAIRAGGDHGIRAGTVPPWRLDPSWRELVALSWLRMQPFVGTVILEPLPGSRRRRRYWEISYFSADPQHRGETTTIRLRSTGLYRPGSTRRVRAGAVAAR